MLATKVTLTERFALLTVVLKIQVAWDVILY